MTTTMRSTRELTCLTTSAAIALTLAACSGSDSDYAGVTPLAAPEGVSLVEPDTSNVSTGASSVVGAGLQYPANSAYVQDAASIKLFEPALRAVENANNIMCQVGMTRFDAMTGVGPYIAQVDPALCGDTPDPTNADGQETILRLFTVDSTRASNSDPQEVAIWLDLDENGTPIEIFATVTVTEAPTETDPFGAFEFHYAGVPNGTPVTDPFINATIVSAAGQDGFQFMDEEGDVDVAPANPGDSASRTQITVVRNPDGSGAAKITASFRENNGGVDSGIQSQTTRVVFDADSVLKQVGADPAIALSRNDFRDNVFAYNLYHATGPNIGERVQVNSGIGVEFPGGEYGWVGYYGVWAESPESFDDGDQVTATDDGTPYTVLKAPGRLLKFTRASLALADLGDQRFEWYEGQNRFQVAYDGAEWERVAQWDGQVFQEIVTPTMIDVAAAGGFLSMYSPFLGGVNYVDGESALSYFASSLVNGDSDLFTSGQPVELVATVEALKGEIDQTEADAGDIFLPVPANVNSAHEYVIDPADMTLMLDVNGDGSVLEQVGLAAGIVPNGGPNEWGMRSGPMVTAAVLAGLQDVTDVYTVAEFYVYETGHNPWNEFVALTDASGGFLTFDEPIEFLYTHDQLNDINDDASFDGQQVFLQYNGPGRMWGIPGTEIDVDGDSVPDQYFPDFSIADGTLVGPNSEYVIRAVGVEQTMTVLPGGAPQLDITDADPLVVPPASIYVTPEIGARPVVEDAPRVIDGVVQTAGN